MFHVLSRGRHDYLATPHVWGRYDYLATPHVRGRHAWLESPGVGSTAWLRRRSVAAVPSPHSQASIPPSMSLIELPFPHDALASDERLKHELD